MKTLVSILMLLMTLVCFSQKGAIICAGENTTTNDRIINWSIGHTVTIIGNTQDYIVYPGATTPKYYILYNKETDQLNIKCFPNPAQDYFFLELETNDYDKLHWELYNSKGEKVKSGKSDSNIIKVEIANLDASAYYITVLDENQHKVSSAKLLKQ